MAEKKKQQTKILPPLEQLIGGTTEDLVSEALKKVIPYPLHKKDEKSAPPPTAPSSKVKPIESEQERKKKTKKKSPSRLHHPSVETNSAISKLRSDVPATTIPSHSTIPPSHSSATSYPTITYLITPHFLLDEVLPTLNTYEQVLLIRLYRLSYGFSRQMTDHVGKKTLADKCNMSIAMVKKVLKSLESRELIETIPDRSSDPTKGNKYKVLTRLSKDPVLLALRASTAQLPYNRLEVNLDDDNMKNK